MSARKRKPNAHTDTIGPTPERLARASGKIEHGNDRTNGGTVFVDHWPIRQYYARGPAATRLSEREYNAAMRFYAHWYYAGLNPIGAIDYRMEHLDGKWSPSGLKGSERQAHHRQHYTQAVRALGKTEWCYVSAIVLDERDAGTIAMQLTGRTDPAQCRAVGIEILKIGLEKLCDLWGM
jgi:hypothetical protein